MENLKALINAPSNFLVDVRTPEEVAEISVSGARNIPLDELTQHVDEFKDMAQDGEVILFCRSGARSGRALDFLQQAGVPRLHNAGGYADVLSLKD